MAICWGLGLLVIVTRVSKFFSNSGWWWAFEYMEENLRTRMDDILRSSEILVIQSIPLDVVGHQFSLRPLRGYSSLFSLFSSLWKIHALLVLLGDTKYEIIYIFILKYLGI